MKLTHQNQTPVIKGSNIQMKFLLAASADVDRRLLYMHVFSIELYFQTPQLVTGCGVSRHFEKKSSHLKACNLVPVCHWV